MSIKFIKIRLNTDNPLDKDVLQALKKVTGQNTFIKKAILSYSGKGSDEIMAERIALSVIDKLKTSPVLSVAAPIQSEPVMDDDTAAESADIADAFLESL